MVFQYHFDFADEDILTEHSSVQSRGVIRICRKEKLPDLPYRYPWTEASGRELRYMTHMPFSEDQNILFWGMEIKDVLSLYWDHTRQELWYTEGKEYTPERLRFWVYHTFAPIMFELHETYRIIHVGAVEIAGRAVLFAAPSFGGKSTLTAHFLERGHSLLSDDTLGIEKRDQEYRAIPSYPFYRPYREAETLGYKAEQFALEPKPVACIYQLERSDNVTSVVIEKVTGIDKFKVLHYSSFVYFSFMKEERFSFFTQMADTVPLYKITYPNDIERVPDVYHAVILHTASLS